MATGMANSPLGLVVCQGWREFNLIPLLTKPEKRHNDTLGVTEWLYLATNEEIVA